MTALGRLRLGMDYATLLRAEEQLGAGIMAVAALLARGMLPMKDMTALVALCARPAPARDGLGEALLAMGVAEVAAALADLLQGVLQGLPEGDAPAAEDLRGQMEGLMARFPDRDG